MALVTMAAVPSGQKKNVTFWKKLSLHVGRGEAVASARRTESLFASFSSEKEVPSRLACLHRQACQDVESML
jgi:hypothetical protein